MTKFVDEVEPTTGLYAAYRVSRETAKNILNWARAQGLSHVMRPSKMHVTTLYSKRFVNYTPSRKPVGATFDHFKIFPEKDKTGFGTLVAVVHSPALVDRWAEARRQGATYDFPDYVPHISLGRVPTSYKLSSLKDFDFPIIFSHEYALLTSWGDGPHGYQIGNELMILSNADDVAALDRENDEKLYYVQPDGSFQKGGDRRSAGIPREDVPLDAKINSDPDSANGDNALTATGVIASYFKIVADYESDASAAERRRTMRGKCISASLGGDMVIPIYRATSANSAFFDKMDYVTRSLKFATGHADHQAAVNAESFQVLKANVNSKHVFEAPNPGELFYDGPTVKGRQVYLAEVE